MLGKHTHTHTHVRASKRDLFLLHLILIIGALQSCLIYETKDLRNLIKGQYNRAKFTFKFKWGIKFYYSLWRLKSQVFKISTTDSFIQMFFVKKELQNFIFFSENSVIYDIYIISE